MIFLWTRMSLIGVAALLLSGCQGKGSLVPTAAGQTNSVTCMANATVSGVALSQGCSQPAAPPAYAPGQSTPTQAPAAGTTMPVYSPIQPTQQPTPRSSSLPLPLPLPPLPAPTPTIAPAPIPTHTVVPGPIFTPTPISIPPPTQAPAPVSPPTQAPTPVPPPPTQPPTPVPPPPTQAPTPVPPPPTQAPTPVPPPPTQAPTPVPPPPTQAPTPISTPAPSGTPLWVNITFYSYPENNNSTVIAYAQSDGFPTTANQAGGSGSYSNPVTMASTTSLFSPGTKLYVYTLKKYVEMEDSCSQCSSDWSNSRIRDIMIWIGGNSSTSSSALTQCENTLMNLISNSPTSSQVLVNPSSGLSVNTTPLFNTSTNTCW